MVTSGDLEPEIKSFTVIDDETVQANVVFTLGDKGVSFSDEDKILVTGDFLGRYAQFRRANKGRGLPNWYLLGPDWEDSSGLCGLLEFPPTPTPRPTQTPRPLIPITPITKQ